MKQINSVSEGQTLHGFHSLMCLRLTRYIKCCMWNGMKGEAKLFRDKGE